MTGKHCCAGSTEGTRAARLGPTRGDRPCTSFSRSIYRELAPDILEDRPGHDGPTNHERVLRACEAARLPARHRLALLRQADQDAVQRHPDLLPDVAQERVYRVVDRYMTFAREYFASLPPSGYDLDGQPARVPRHDAHGHAVPAHAAAAQRLLPVAPAPGRAGERRSPTSPQAVRRSPPSAVAWRAMRVGFIGLGIMGSRQAANLRARRLRADRLQPHARDAPRRGRPSTAATSPPRPREVAEGADTVITMVVDGAQVEEMLLGEDGAVARRAPRARCSSTCRRSRPADARRIGGALTERGHGFVDAPVTGSAPKAEDGTLTIMAGGSDEDMRARAAAVRGDGRDDRPRRRGRPGPGGQGDLQRGHAPSTAPTLAQALVVGRRAGVDLEALLEVMGAGSAELDDAPAQGRADARARLHAAVQARAHAQGRRAVPRRGARGRRARSRSPALARRALRAPASAAASASRTSPPCSRSSRASAGTRSDRRVTQLTTARHPAVSANLQGDFEISRLCA